MRKNMTPQRIELSKNNFHTIQPRTGNGMCKRVQQKADAVDAFVFTK